MLEEFLKDILRQNNIQIDDVEQTTIHRVKENSKAGELFKTVVDVKKEIMKIFNLYDEKEKFKKSNLIIANANAKKYYETSIDLGNFPNIVIDEIRNLQELGLYFDSQDNKLYGTPKIATTIDLQIIFHNINDESKSEDIKIVPFIINADPKDLWLDIASDQNAIYAKDDQETYRGNFLDKKIVVASKRGRSHAHEGGFRDDDFRIENLSDSWSIAAVCDGAGSAKYSREGSRFVSEFMVSEFNDSSSLELLKSFVIKYYELQKELDLLVKSNSFNTSNSKQENLEIETIVNLEESTDDLISQGDSLSEHKLLRLIEEKELDLRKYKSDIINVLYKSVLKCHNKLKDFADQEEVLLRDLHTTLIFTLCRKFDFGYVFLSFGVGDCPMNILYDGLKKVKLINELDVGEYGGGTRFITMPEVFTNEIVNRFRIDFFKDFDKIFLMTDGIYDPKFITERKLSSIECWSEFLSDLQGNNEDKTVVDFANDTVIDQQLLEWLNFWSKGNHDDRTLAIIY